MLFELIINQTFSAFTKCFFRAYAMLAANGTPFFQIKRPETHI
jgi:hypothetical protein